MPCLPCLSLIYDTTGKVTQVSDQRETILLTVTPPASSRIPSRAANLPAAYLTSVTLLVSGAQSFGYYFNQGKLAVTTDRNAQSICGHYEWAKDDSVSCTLTNVPPIVPGPHNINVSCDAPAGSGTVTNGVVNVTGP